MFVDGLCYADAAHALRRILQVCLDFASEKKLTFNAGKIQFICFCSHISVVVDERFEFLRTGVTYHRICCSPRPHSVMWSLWLWGYL